MESTSPYSMSNIRGINVILPSFPIIHKNPKTQCFGHFLVSCYQKLDKLTFYYKVHILKGNVQVINACLT